MRKKGKEVGSIPITPRQLEALVRMSEARAKMALREEATKEDAEAAMRLMSYVLETTAYDRETQSIDIDVLMTGKSRSQREKLGKLMDIIREKIREISGPVKREEIVEAAKNAGLEESFIELALEKLSKEGVIFEPRQGYIMLT